MTKPFIYTTPEESVNAWLNSAEEALEQHDPIRVFSGYEQMTYHRREAHFSQATRRRMGHARFTLWLPARIMLLESNIAYGKEVRANIVAQGRKVTKSPTDHETWQADRVAEYKAELAEWKSAGRPESYPDCLHDNR